MHSRVTARKGVPAPSGRRVPPLAVAAVAVLLLIWILWIAWPQSPVRNLDSRGSAIIAFGDSLTAGYGASAGEDYPARLSALAGVTVVNAGVSGDTTESAIARIERDVLSGDPRIVIVGLGGNDFLRGSSLGETEKNLRSIVKQIQAAGAAVVVLGFEFPSFNADYAAMYERIARDEECLLIEEVLDGILTSPSLKSDSIHPNARGYALMAERIAGPLQGLVKRAEKARE